jgi:hypothetical protein
MAATPTAVMGGHPLNIKVFESVGHFGFYRVALALHSRSELPVDNVVYDAQGKVLPPSGMPSGTSARADVENPAKFPVLADNLFLHDTSAPNGTMYMGDVMIPNVACDRCILQVIEFMHPHGFNTSVPPPGGGYFYHHCAELKITPDNTMPIFNPDGTADAGVDASTGGTGGNAGATGTAGSGSAAGSGGTAGSTGSAGAMGMAGASGGSPGTAGMSLSGAAGSTGAAGSGSTGAAGAGSGAAGATGGTAGQHKTGGGGCSISGEGARGASLAGLLLAAAVVIARRRRISR